jgi:two-component system, NarL family, response regulator DevR
VPSPEPNLRVTPLRIFILEDSTRLRDRLVLMITQYPQLTVSVISESEADAKRKCETKEFDALVADLELSPGNGIGVIKHLRQLNQDTPIVVLTNYNLPSVREYSLAAGANYFLDKMREIDQLIPILLAIAAQPRADGDAT